MISKTQSWPHPFLTAFFCLAASLAQAVTIPVAHIGGSINPGTADYVLSSIDKAEQMGAPFLVLELDTPGGLLSSTRIIVQKMLNAKIPIVVFVAPKGSRATSAGALIALASEVTVMASGTHIGAAHPVLGDGQKMDDAIKAKLVNDTVAFAESLARTTGRSPEWAAKIVKESLAVSAEEAVKHRAVDFIVENRAELFKRLADWKWKKMNPEQAKLKSGEPRVQILEPSLKQELVSFFSDPTLAYLILSLAGLCLWIELSNPGLILPGVLAVFCGLLSLVSFQLMPISYGAVGLMLLGMTMLFAELFLPTFGLLGLAGVVCFVFGSLFLVDTQTGALGVPLPLILTMAAIMAGAAVALGTVVWKSRKGRKFSGSGGMLGELGEVAERVDQGKGMVMVRGELWKARSESAQPIEKGTSVEVTDMRDLTVTVRPKPV